MTSRISRGPRHSGQTRQGIRAESEERFTCLNIAFSKKGVSEYSGERCVVFIPREEIQLIETKTGSRAENPLVQGIAGFLLSAVGLFAIYMVIKGGAMLLRWEAGFLVFGGVGVWLLWEALRQGRYLRVVCAKGDRKLIFHGTVNESELQEFSRNTTRLGYNWS